MKHQTHLKGWIFVMFVGLLIVPMFVTAQSGNQRIKSEIAKVRSIFGDNAADTVVNRANKNFDYVFVNSGAVGYIESRIATQEQQDDAALHFGGDVKVMSGAANRYIIGLITNMYGFFFRFNLIMIWLPLSIPFLIGTVIDTLVARKLKTMIFAYFSPAAFQASSHVLIFTMMLPLSYLIIPIVMNPLWIPGLLIAMAAGIRIALLNMQRVTN